MRQMHREWALVTALAVAALWMGAWLILCPAGAASTVAPGAVVINEVAWGGTAASSSDEWIELFNTTTRTISLEGWRLVDDDNLDIALHGEIAPYGYYLIERTDDGTVSNVPADLTAGFGYGLSNSGEVLTLTDALGNVVDTANGAGGAWPAGSGSPAFLSMERVDPTAPDAPDNWASHDGTLSVARDADGNPLHGTPGFRNSAAAPAADVVATKRGPAATSGERVLTYTLTLRNRGNLTATGVLVTDTLPRPVVAVTPQGGVSFTAVASHTVRWAVGDLPVALAPTYITFAVEIAPSAVGTLTNRITATTATTEAYPLNNAATWETALPPKSPRLTLRKVGPRHVEPHIPLTYALTLSNTGGLAAPGVVLTDFLPLGMSLITQTSALPFTQVDTRTLRWRVGALPAGGEVTVTLVLTPGVTTVPTFTNVAVATDGAGERVTATWTTTASARVLLYALQPGNYGGSGEAAALINLSPYPADVGGRCLDDALASTTRVCFPAGAFLPASSVVWLAERAEGFRAVWGFDAQWAADVGSRPVAPLEGRWPGFTDAGEAVYLVDAEGQAVDVLLYGDEESAVTGWSGPAVPHPYEGYDALGQVLYRKLDEATGLPVADSDRREDWAQDPDDPLRGRKVRYPGWDLESLFFPPVLTTTARITLAVAPEGSLALVSETLASARASILFEGYTFGSEPLYRLLADRLRAGVVLTALLEGNPSGGLADVERWVMQQLHDPPTATVYLMGGETPRYRFQHAKFLVVDDRLALISTDNPGESSMPSDPKANGTMGHRGFVLVTDAPQVVAYLKRLFALDCDPRHHADIIPYNDDYAPPSGFVPLPPVDWTTYTAPFSGTFAATAEAFTLLHAPEHSLRERDGLLGLIEATEAGDAIDVMQLNETLAWSTMTTTLQGDAGYNPRLMALIRAARRGVRVRLLLDAFYDDPTNPNGNTAVCLYLNGLRVPGLECRLANVTGLGIHAKLFLVRRGAEQWVNLGSLNGTEGSSKVNRELMAQFRSAAAYQTLAAVFEHDWALSHGPMVYRLYLPLVFSRYEPPIEYPVVTEVFINPEGEDAGREWIELYHPGRESVDLSGWTLGDALNEGDYGDGRMAFPAGAVLRPQQVMVVAACATTFAAKYGFNPAYEWTACDPGVPDLVTPTVAWEGFGIALGNAADEVLLLDGGGGLVDSVAWGGEPRADVVPFPVAEGETFPWDASLKRYPVNYDTDDCSRDFYVSYTPSPGKVPAP